MSTPRSLSICPDIVVVAKPKRSTWCKEELYDLAEYLNGEVQEMASHEVCALYLRSESSIDDILRGIRYYKFSFASRVAITYSCAFSRDDLLTRIKYIINKFKLLNINVVRIIFSPRGESKKYVEENEVIKVISNNKIIISKRAQTILDIEGLGDRLAISFGKAGSCGYQCLLIPGRI